MKKFLLSVFFLQLLITFSAFAQVNGKVYHNKLIQLHENIEKQIGISQIRIKAYQLSSEGKLVLFQETQSDPNGNYNLDIADGESVKIVFEKDSEFWESSENTPVVVSFP